MQTTRSILSHCVRGLITTTLVTLLMSTLPSTVSAQPTADHDALVKLWQAWRAFEQPPLHEGAPDYRAERFAAAASTFQLLEEQLNRMDIDAWPIAEQVDWHILRAEMNGWIFNDKVLKPWQRDPAFYQTLWDYRSDVPAHEGPTHHAAIELWRYRFPLDAAAQAQLAHELNVIPPLMAQAKVNLTGNARDLWIAGTRDIEQQSVLLRALQQRTADDASPDLRAAISAAIAASDQLVDWLHAQAPTKQGTSGVGEANYSWYQMQVHYLPMDWTDEYRLLQRELDRAWSSLVLEEHRNRQLPPLEAASTASEYQALVAQTSQQMLDWLAQEEILPMRDYMTEELVAHLGGFEPPEARNFFTIGSHHDPRPLLSHFYHWFDLAEIDNYPHPSPIRRGPLLYNIFDTRNEGTATGVEEMFMHAGLYADSPRSREIVWIMLAQRAARGLGSLDAHANHKTMAEAGTVHVDWTPRNWMRNEPELLAFEQHLYLRQPGYGTSYITGKYLLEKLLASRSQQMRANGEPYPLRSFFRELRDTGSIPIALVHWQLTGDDSDIRRIMAASRQPRPF